MENFRITIGRQYGSGGKEIGRILSRKLGIPFYGKEELMKIAKDQDDYEEVRAFYEEQPVNSLLYAIAMRQGENRAGEIPFQKIRELCGGRPCILIGRCGSYIFRDDPSCVKIFIYAGMVEKIQWIGERLCPEGPDADREGGRRTGSVPQILYRRKLGKGKRL